MGAKYPAAGGRFPRHLFEPVVSHQSDPAVEGTARIRAHGSGPGILPALRVFQPPGDLFHAGPAQTRGRQVFPQLFQFLLRNGYAMLQGQLLLCLLQGFW